MNLTNEQIAILAHVVIDPQAWVAHAINTVGEHAVLQKIDKYRNEYLAKKDTASYLTRAQRHP
jgi:hypothetical protein